jgi:hypothetical protein
MLKLTWRDVLDVQKAWVGGNHISDFLPYIKMSGYEYFAWNGRVYKFDVNDSYGLNHPVTKDITAEDLQ